MASRRKYRTGQSTLLPKVPSLSPKISLLKAAWIFGISLIVFFAFIIFYPWDRNVRPKPTIDEQKLKEELRILDALPPDPSLSETTHILLYNSFYGDKNWGIGSDVADHEYFKDLNCPITSCVVTSNRTYLPDISHYDAIVFFGHHAGGSREYPPPNTRRPQQIYVLGMLESPDHMWRRFDRERGLFNWTMTYRLVSDVLMAYGYFVEQRTDVVVAPALQPIWRHPDYTRNFLKTPIIREMINGKKKMAAWFVSNCDHTSSHRMEVAKALQQYVPVDIYGRCGNLSCPKSSHTECMFMLESDYKFYLAFENSLCPDYVTEKVFNAMDYYTIPVVFNGADNAQFLPPHSYLDVNQFQSVRALGARMQYLADHPEEYIKYFWWREFYDIRMDGQNFCQLCLRLQNLGVTSQMRVYPDIDKWFRKPACKHKLQIDLS